MEIANFGKKDLKTTTILNPENFPPGAFYSTSIPSPDYNHTQQSKANFRCNWVI